jgi:hypothetical protein
VKESANNDERDVVGDDAGTSLTVSVIILTLLNCLPLINRAAIAVLSTPFVFRPCPTTTDRPVLVVVPLLLLFNVLMRGLLVLLLLGDDDVDDVDDVERLEEDDDDPFDAAGNNNDAGRPYDMLFT